MCVSYEVTVTNVGYVDFSRKSNFFFVIRHIIYVAEQLTLTVTGLRQTS